MPLIARVQPVCRVGPEEAVQFDAFAQALHAWLPTVIRWDGVHATSIIRWARRNSPFPFIALGEDRAVFALPNARVLKIVVEPYTSANRMEHAVWTRAPRKVKKYLVPVLDVSPTGDWLVQERVAVLDARASVSDAARAVLAAYGIGDFTSANFSVDGRMLDYAQGPPGMYASLVWV